MNSTMHLKQFQDQVSELLLRHRSLLDVLSKFQQTNSSVHRATIKAITECGCIEIDAKKQQYPDDLTMEQAKEALVTHLSGELCEQCKEVVSAEIGRNLFYLSSMCNQLDINLDDVLQKESEKCYTLGRFNLS